MDWTRVPEMGRAWEETLFGGEVKPINCRVDGGAGIGISDWPPRGSEGDVGGGIWWGVPMHWIENLFQKSTWKGRSHIEGDGQADWLKIPRTGACSVYINFFTTMTPAEARRVEEEEMRMEVEKVKVMPPEKVRVVGMGDREEKRTVETIGTLEEIAPKQRISDSVGDEGSMSKNKSEKGARKTTQLARNRRQKPKYSTNTPREEYPAPYSATDNSPAGLTATSFPNAKAPIFTKTKSLIATLPTLPTSRDDSEEDRASWLTVSRLYAYTEGRRVFECDDGNIDM